MLTKKEKIVLKSEKIRRREKNIKVVRIGLIITVLFLIIIYFLLKIIYETGAFTISLDPQLEMKSGIIMYEKLAEKDEKKILKAQKLEVMDNISVDWLPKNIDSEAEGGHNGENYIAYTFYLENKGADDVNYWYRIVVDDVIKNIDKAVRVMVYRNDEKTIYGKLASNGNAETGTTPFYSDSVVTLQNRKGFKPNDIDKFTIVIWIEGDDPDCIDSLIGGEMKMHMEITEEHLDKNGNPTEAQEGTSTTTTN